MNKNQILFVLFFAFSLTILSQAKKDILMTINGTTVSTFEFKRVYKKNLNLVQDESQKNVDGYLDLFIDYKLKVAEAYSQKLHEEPNYQKEFAKYQDQLSRKYIYEDRVTEDIAREAFERGLEEIDVDHILVRSSFNDSPQDTLGAYTKLEEIRQKALAGEDFNELAKQHSEEPGSDQRAGKLGYFSAFDMVYPFESMAYNTKVGEISEIVRTSFGYHFLKIKDRRKRAPKITVSHIMISDNKETRTFDPKERINEIASLLEQGQTFEALAEQYSDDKNSAKRGGKLLPFSKGSLRSKLFEENAYSLKNIAEISKPFKSEFGWHIVRLEKVHTIPAFEEEREVLEKRVKEGNRSKLVTSVINKKIMDKYGFQKGESYLPYFETYVGDEVYDRKWEYKTIDEAEDKVLFVIGNQELRFDAFAQYIDERQRRGKVVRNKKALLKEYYEGFEDKIIKDYFKIQLELENEEYASVINEYRDGLLIFDLMEKNIWNKAKTDSLGLAKFYEGVKQKYKWSERVDAVVISAADEVIAKSAQEMLIANKTVEEIKEAININDKVNILVTEGQFELSQRELPSNFVPEIGVSKIHNENNSFKVVKVIKILPISVKKLDEVKGRVLSEYQTNLEKNWIADLRAKYKVDINKKALKKIKKELKS